MSSSVEAKRSFPYHSAYGASKHGIDGFLEAMRLELIHEHQCNQCHASLHQHTSV